MAKKVKRLSRTVYLLINSLFFGAFVLVASSVPQLLKKSGEVAEADTVTGYAQGSYVPPPPYNQSGYYAQSTYYAQSSYVPTPPPYVQSGYYAQSSYYAQGSYCYYTGKGMYCGGGSGGDGGCDSGGAGGSDCGPM